MDLRVRLIPLRGYHRYSLRVQRRCYWTQTHAGRRRELSLPVGARAPPCDAPGNTYTGAELGVASVASVVVLFSQKSKKGEEF